MGRTMMAASVAMLAPVALSVKKFGEFDDKMREVKAVTQDAGAGFVMLTEKAKQLGATTSFTAVQVAELMAELGRAGFKPDEIEAMTGAVLDLARATSTDATKSSGIMAATIRQFGLEASDAARVADVLTVAANGSFNTVEMLGAALSKAGPVAKDLGMSFEETVAAFATLGNLGIQAEEAGTALKRISLTAAADADKLQRIFGVAFKDANNDVLPLIDVLEAANEATKDLGSAARAAKFNEAFGLRGITGASALGQAAGSTRDMLEKLIDAQGRANKAAKEMDSGLGGAMRILNSAIEGVGLAIGEALDITLTDAIKNVTEITGKAIAWIKENKELVVTLTKVALGVGAVGAGLTALGLIVSTLAVAVGGLAALVSPLGLAFAAVALAAGAVAGELYLLSDEYLTLADAQEKARAAGDELRAVEQAKIARLQELASKEKLNAEEMQEASALAAELTERYGDVGIEIDKFANKVDLTTEAIEKMNAQLREQAMIQLDAEIAEANKNVSELQQKMDELSTFRNQLGHVLSYDMFGDPFDDAISKAGVLGAKLIELKKRREALANGDAAAIAGGAATAGKGAGAGAGGGAGGGGGDEAADIAKKLDAIEERIAARRRSRVEQEIRDIRELAKERRELLEQQKKGAEARDKELDDFLGRATGSAGSGVLASRIQSQLDANDQFERDAIAEAKAKETKAEDEKRRRKEKAKEEERTLADQTTKDEIARLEIQADPKLTKLQKEQAQLELERKRALREADQTGADKGLIDREFKLRAGLLKDGEGGRQKVFSTFSASAALAGGGQTAPLNRIAGLLDKQARDQKARDDELLRAVKQGRQLN